jgi:hypothetical protein
LLTPGSASRLYTSRHGAVTMEDLLVKLCEDFGDKWPLFLQNSVATPTSWFLHLSIADLGTRITKHGCQKRSPVSVCPHYGVAVSPINSKMWHLNQEDNHHSSLSQPLNKYGAITLCQSEHLLWIGSAHWYFKGWNSCGRSTFIYSTCGQVQTQVENRWK